jgi:hypothetical protein
VKRNQKSDRDSWSLIGKTVLGKKKRKGKSRGKGGAPNLPPVLQYTTTVDHVYRFGCVTNSTLSAVTGATLATAIGGVATSGSNLAAWASSFLIKKITIWPSAETASDSTPSVVWTSYGEQSKDSVKGSALPQGITIEKALVTHPPRNSLASMWQVVASNSNTLFTLTMEAGAIIDVHVVYTISNGLVGGATATTSGMTTGKVYYDYLDGVANAHFAPTGVNMIP